MKLAIKNNNRIKLSDQAELKFVAVLECLSLEKKLKTKKTNECSVASLTNCVHIRIRNKYNRVKSEQKP